MNPNKRLESLVKAEEVLDAQQPLTPLYHDGQALKNERLAQNKTQREWIRDIHISVSRYSEIENGVIKNGKKADIGSEQLILLLESNAVSNLFYFLKAIM